jgi:hypothetical protein
MYVCNHQNHIYVVLFQFLEHHERFVFSYKATPSPAVLLNAKCILITNIYLPGLLVHSSNFELCILMIIMTSWGPR